MYLDPIMALTLPPVGCLNPATPLSISASSHLDFHVTSFSGQKVTDDGDVEPRVDTKEGAGSQDSAGVFVSPEAVLPRAPSLTQTIPEATGTNQFG